MRRALLVAPALVLLGVLGFGLFRARPQAGLGDPAPEFSLPALASPRERLALRDFRGKPLVINFWASWCEPCRDEAPELAGASERAQDDVAFLGVNILDGRDEALAFQRRYRVRYPSVRDASGRLAKVYGVTGVPETVFVDSRGRVAGKYVGAFTPGQLDGLVDTLRMGKRPNITGRGETRPVP